jgi:endonuclease/exonuclease/phosphatase family metal-dependent hydrolase
MNFHDRVVGFLRGPAPKNLFLRVPSRPKGRLVLTGLLVATIATIFVAKGEKTDFVRLSKPELLSFDELVQLEKTEKPEGQLADRLTQLLQTPLISNEAYFAGAKPNRPSSDQLGPFIRATMWNIERGSELDGILTALTAPDNFGKYIEAKKEPDSKPLTSAELGVVKDQLSILGQTDLFILNEVDNGVTRTDYRDVGHELATALKMNYAYGVEFLEVDPLNLGIEQVKMEDKAAEADIQKSFQPDKSRYLGLHGTAVLSRYPIRKATVKALPVCHDWYGTEKKEVSKLESGKRWGSNAVFMERISREVRRGGRMALIVELAVPESPTGAVTVVATHLENKCKPGCRKKQFAQILEWVHADANPVVIAGDMNTTATDSSPTSALKILKDRVKDPHAWARDAIKWTTGAPTILLMPVNYLRAKNDPTGVDVPIFSRKTESALFKKMSDFHFDDGHTFDFRGENVRSADNRGGTLSDSNQRAGKGFRYTFALPQTYGGLVGEFKLDWFFVKGYATDAEKSGGDYKFAPHFGRTLQEMNGAPDEPLSDHSPITIDVPLEEPHLSADRR